MKKRKYNTINGTLDKNFKVKKFALGVQDLDIGEKPKPPKNNVGRGITSTLASTASGFASGGPIGAGIGLLTGLISNKESKKERERQYLAELEQYEDDKIESLHNLIRDPSTEVAQLNQAKKGIYRTGTEAIEVEKDELIFKKNPIGSYILKADFKGGKTHNKGGEDFIAEEGDIIFPGKDRKKVLKAYREKNYPKLESMRLKLPKDTNIAQEGLDNTDPVKEKRKRELFQKQLQGGLSAEEELELENINKSLLSTQLSDSSGMNEVIDKLKFSLQENVGFNPEDDVRVAKRPIAGALDFDRKENLNQISDETSLSNVVSNKNTANIPNATTQKVGLEDFTRDLNPNFSFDPSINIPNTTSDSIGSEDNLPNKGNNIIDNLPLGELSQLAAASVDLFPGEAEIQKSPEVSFTKLRHKDTSEKLRKASKINQKVQETNARNLSGGNVQNLLANKRIAGIENLRNLQNIDAEEFKRGQLVADRNVSIENKERLINNRIKRQDELVNAQNRAARVNQINSGIKALGQLGGVFGRDSKAKIAEEKLLKTLNSLNLFEVLDSGEVTLKQQKNGNK